MDSVGLLPSEQLCIACVIGYHGESEDAKIVRVEREDVFDVALVGENAGRVVDERDVLIVVAVELLTGDRETRLVRMEYRHRWRGADASQRGCSQRIVRSNETERDEFGEDIARRLQRSIWEGSRFELHQTPPSPDRGGSIRA